MNKLPEIVARLCYSSDAWIVGSAADPKIESPRDYDVAVPYYSWHVAATIIPPESHTHQICPNTFGGWKIYGESKSIDVWPCDLSRLLTYHEVKYVWHPKSGKRFSCE